VIFIIRFDIDSIFQISGMKCKQFSKTKTEFNAKIPSNSDYKGKMPRKVSLVFIYKILNLISYSGFKHYNLPIKPQVTYNIKDEVLRTVFSLILNYVTTTTTTKFWNMLYEKKASGVWKHFTYVGKPQVNCYLCNKTLQYSGNTNNLRRQSYGSCAMNTFSMRSIYLQSFMLIPLIVSELCQGQISKCKNKQRAIIQT
jgi:hypothetical protein